MGYETPMIWAEVDVPVAETEPRWFAMVGTGHGEVPTTGKYIGTAICGAFVWYFYECFPLAKKP